MKTTNRSLHGFQRIKPKSTQALEQVLDRSTANETAQTYATKTPYGSGFEDGVQHTVAAQHVVGGPSSTSTSSTQAAKSSRLGFAKLGRRVRNMAFAAAVTSITLFSCKSEATQTSNANRDANPTEMVRQGSSPLAVRMQQLTPEFSGQAPDSLVEDAAAGVVDGRGVETPSPVQVFGAAVAKLGHDNLAHKTKAHADAQANTGIGLYYGDHSSFHKLGADAKQAYLDTHKTADLVAQPKVSSCIGWALENVGDAYKAAGKGDRWSDIYRTVTRNGSKGTDLAKELQKDGWEAVYFNPDSKTPNDGNSEHPYTAAITAKGKPYYGIDVDHRVVDYRPTSGSSTTENAQGLANLDQVPFWFGLAKGGMHTFVGHGDTVNEFHWDQDPDDTNAIEETQLKNFAWNSGVIMVPPGTWPTP